MRTLADRVRALLNVYWLRPETALWRACDIRAMSRFCFESPSLDLGCGDGLFSFLRAGGSLSPQFDAFRSVTSLDRFFSKVDVYDSFDSTFALEVVQPPEYRIDVGLDHKSNLLRKAQPLGLYLELKVADANGALPFPDASFRTVFSNIVYWLDDPAAVLREIHRILMPGGKACVLLPNSTLRDFSFYWALHVRTGDPAFRFLEQLDRGRLAGNIKQVKSSAEWRSLILEAGLEVEEHVQYMARPIVQIWDVGLRPLFPVLHKMVSALDSQKAADIKREWVDTFQSFLAPLAEMDPQIDTSAEPAFHFFVVRR